MIQSIIILSVIKLLKEHNELRYHRFVYSSFSKIDWRIVFRLTNVLSSLVKITFEDTFLIKTHFLKHPAQVNVMSALAASLAVSTVSAEGSLIIQTYRFSWQFIFSVSLVSVMSCSFSSGQTWLARLNSRWISISCPPMLNSAELERDDSIHHVFRIWSGL